MIEELQKFFARCPYLAEREIDIDYLDAGRGSFGIEAVPCEPILKRYLTGGSLRQYCFAVVLRESFGMSPGENMKNEQLCENIADWVEKQSISGEMPVLGGGRTVQDIGVTSGGYMFDQVENHAKYRICLRMTYTQF